ncbi:MAG: VanZ family protein [Candidatus Phosphoribacter sp.]|nr:VanZ family protein [Actinomycetales bacterium]
MAGAGISGRRWRVAFALVVLVHLVALYWPRVEMPDAPSGTDKLAHLLLFGVPALLSVVTLRQPWPFLAVLSLHAPLSEWLQSTLLPSRSGDLIDSLADLAGVAIGVLLGLRQRGRRALGPLVNS